MLIVKKKIEDSNRLYKIVKKQEYNLNLMFEKKVNFYRLYKPMIGQLKIAKNWSIMSAKRSKKRVFDY